MVCLVYSTCTMTEGRQYSLHFFCLVLLAFIQPVQGSGISPGAIVGLVFLALVIMAVIVMLFCCGNEVRLMFGIQRQPPRTMTTALTVPTVRQVTHVNYGVPPQNQHIAISACPPAGFNLENTQAGFAPMTSQQQFQSGPPYAGNFPPVEEPPPPYPGK